MNPVQQAEKAIFLIGGKEMLPYWKERAGCPDEVAAIWALAGLIRYNDKPDKNLRRFTEIIDKASIRSGFVALEAMAIVQDPRYLPALRCYLKKENRPKFDPEDLDDKTARIVDLSEDRMTAIQLLAKLGGKLWVVNQG